MKMFASRAVAALLLALGAFTVAAEADGPTEELVFLTWADYMDPEVVTEFEKEHGIKIVFRYFESDDARDEIVAGEDGRGYDLVMVNGLMVHSYAQRSWLAPVGALQIPNAAHLDTRWRTAFPSSERYGVPYFWGTLGIAYRRDLVPEGIATWKDFFAPPERLRGRISLLRSSRDVIGMALKSLGHSANTEDRDAIREAAGLLLAQRPFVRSYEYVSLTEKSALVTGEIWASMMYSGDALMVQEFHEDIVYVVPEEGSNLWVDYLAVMQSSPRKDLAAKFIDFLNRPEIAARNAEFVYCGTPNTAARNHLPTDYFDNKVINPDEAVLSRSEAYRELPPRVQRTLNSEFARVVN